MQSELAARVAAEYGKLLRRLKRADVDIATAPRDVQEAMLALHQNALLHHSSSVAPGTATVDAGPFTGSRARHS